MVALVALVALGAGAGLWYARGPSSSGATVLDREPVVSAAERLTALEHSLRAISDGVRDAPREWDPSFVAEQVGSDPEALRKWVQLNTSWIPYRGGLRGPVGVLMDRQGNSLDRALLLARLLTESGHATRLARATLPLDRAIQLLPDLVARSTVTSLKASPYGEAAPLREVASWYELDPSAIARQLSSYAEVSTKLSAELDTRVSEQTARLLHVVSPADPEAEWRIRRDSALAALQDHWWVQVQNGELWTDLDVLEASSSDTSALTPVQTMSSVDVPPSLFHEIEISVVEERLTGGSLTERRKLGHLVRPSELVGQLIVLQFWPAAFPNSSSPPDDSGRTFRKLASEQEQWNVGIVIGGDVVAGATLAASGSSNANTPGLGGLGGAIARGLSPQDQSNSAEQDSLLTAVRIEYQVNAPGRKSHTIRRTVFDLIGPVARSHWPAGQRLALNEKQRMTRALSLMMQTEILPVVAQLAPEWVTYVGASNILANADLLRAVLEPGFGSDQATTDSLLRTGHHGLSPLHTLAILRQDALGSTGYIDRPVILTRHLFPNAEAHNVGLIAATDIVANEVGVSLAVSDGFAARLFQGVWDTNLEALLAGRSASGNTALAYAESGEWQVIEASRSERVATALSADARALLHQDLERGYTVVAPIAPVVVDGVEFIGWWRIDPHTGDALGIAGNGWGQARRMAIPSFVTAATTIWGQPDYAMLIGAFAEMAKPFVFAYSLCQFIPQEANALNVLRETFWPGFRPIGWNGQLTPGKDFEDVAVENNRRCVIDAILTGFVATAPLLLRTLSYRLEAEVEIERKLLRDRPFTKMSPSRVPTGVRPRAQGYQAPTGRFRPRQGPSGTVPGGGRPGVDPYGKTNPGLPRPTGTSPLPKTPLESNLEKAQQAYDEATKASLAATQDFVRYKNLPLNPRAPWQRSIQDMLEKKADELGLREIEALNELRVAERGVELERNAAMRARVTQGSAPNRAPNPAAGSCQPACGNENPTVRAPAGGNENPTVRAPAAGNENPTVRAPAAGNENPTVRVRDAQAPQPQSRGALEVGSAGAASSLAGPPRPPQ